MRDRVIGDGELGDRDPVAPIVCQVCSNCGKNIMAASDDFKAQLKAGKIVEALALALGEAVELEITTWISSEKTGEAPETAKPGHRLRTRINLLEGDLENEIGDRFLTNDAYKELHEFHRQQVKASHQIVQNNLSSLQHLFNVWVKMRDLDAEAIPLEATAVVEAFPVPPTAPEAQVEDTTHQLLQALPEEPAPVLAEPPFNSSTAQPQDFQNGQITELQLEESLPTAPSPQEEELSPEKKEGWEEVVEEERKVMQSSVTPIDILDWSADENPEEEWVVETSATSPITEIPARSTPEQEADEWEEFDPEELDYPSAANSHHSGQNGKNGGYTDLSWIDDLGLDSSEDEEEDLDETVDPSARSHPSHNPPISEHRG